MANKENMKCNSPVPSNRAGKKKMVKACSNGTEKLLHFGAKGYGNNYSAAARKSFKHQDIGPAKIYGQDRVVQPQAIQVIEEVNTKLWQLFL
jgi:hypothetical protein